MLNCIYTKDKIKKKKKWLDGFITKGISTIRLYDEDKVEIMKSTFKLLEDSNIDALSYLIYLDDVESFLEPCNKVESAEKVVSSKNDCLRKGSANKDFIKNSLQDFKRVKIEIEESEVNVEIEETAVKVEKVEGRSNSDILGLFK